MKTIFLILILVISFNVWADPVGPAELKSVNQGIEKLLNQPAGPDDISLNAKIEILSAEREPDGKLSEVNGKGEIFEIPISFGLSVNEQLINVRGGIELMAVKLGLSLEQLRAMVLFYEAYAERVNSRGRYRVSVESWELQAGTQMLVTVRPVEMSEGEFVERLQLKVMIPANIETTPVLIEVTGSISALAATVVRARIALSQIFNDLALAKQPSVEDLSVIEALIEQVVKAFRESEHEPESEGK